MMNIKHFYIVFLMIIFIVSSCKDKNDKTKEMISGEWEITETIIDDDNISQRYQTCLSPYKYNFFNDSVLVQDGMIYDTETQNHSGRNKYYKFICKGDSLFLMHDNITQREYKINKINDDTLILQRDIFIDIMTRVKCADVQKIDKLNIKYTRINQSEYSANHSFLIEINDNKEVYKSLYIDNANSNHYKGQLLDSYYNYFKDLTRYTKLAELENKTQDSFKGGVYHKINISYEGFENTYLIAGKPENPGVRALLNELNEIVNNIEYLEVSSEEIVDWQKNAPSFNTNPKDAENKTKGS